MRVSFCLPWDWWVCFNRSFEKTPRKGYESDIPWELIRVSCYHRYFREGFLLTMNSSSTPPANSSWSASNSASQKFSLLGFWVLSKVLSTVRATKKAPGVRLTHWRGVLTADRQRQLCPSDQNCRTIGPVTESRTTFATSPLVTKHNAGKAVVKKVVFTHWWHCTSSPLSRWAIQNYFVRTVQRSDFFNECSVLLGIFFLFRKKLHSFSHNTTCTKMWIIV